MTMTGIVIPNDFPSFFNTGAFLTSWADFYQNVYGFYFDSAQVLLPPMEKALGAGVVMVPGITIEQDLAEIRERTENKVLHRHTDRDIDTLIRRDKEAPRPKGVYAAWCAPAVESTDQAPHLALKSYEDIEKEGRLAEIMTFAEYTRLFLWYLWATGRPLDRRSTTLSGSLDADGTVLSGEWFNSRFCVNRQSQRDSFYHRIRARQVVLPSLS